ncbi:MAG: hypothetical protein Q7T36_17225 [Fluviicoccus sp.]|uniref:hypothetical protein n=1 Tax=Fluviicoccus sp. TaxID=2003552 RepID=UPI0027185064|nr:hypothetical protein [Fluviicoccus sp.]MDO8332210.1 hypothetical protein [Fluviicoccus sp.]
MFTRTFKKGPFEFKRINNDSPLYVRILSEKIGAIKFLPDFSEDKGVFILTDFGGEHKEASFSTYSFLICSADKRYVFEDAMISIRKKHNLISPWKELAYKDLRYGPIKMALDDILDAANNLIHGLLFTISIDRRIDTLFGPDKKSAHAQIVDLLKENNLGIWKGNEAEKLLRVCYPVGILLSILTRSEQKILWICDNDSINQNGKSRNFSHTQKLTSQIVAMLSDNQYEIFGFARPFKNDTGTSDLLSITDFSSGVIQEILHTEFFDSDLQVSEEKAKIGRWMGSKSHFLAKHNIAIMKGDYDNLEIRTIELQEKPP